MSHITSSQMLPSSALPPLSPQHITTNNTTSSILSTPTNNHTNNNNAYEFKIIFSKQDVSIYPAEADSKGIEGVITLYYSYDTPSSTSSSASSSFLLSQSIGMPNSPNDGGKSVILSWTPTKPSHFDSIEQMLPSSSSSTSSSSNNPLKRSQPISINKTSGNILSNSNDGGNNNPYQQLKINVREVHSIKKYTPTIGTPYIIVLGKSGTAFPPFFFENGGVREFLKSLVSVSNLRKSNFDTNLYLNDDGATIYNNHSKKNEPPLPTPMITKRIEAQLHYTMLNDPPQPPQQDTITVSSNINTSGFIHQGRPTSPSPSPSPTPKSGSFLNIQPNSPSSAATLSLSPKTPLSLSTVIDREDPISPSHLSTSPSSTSNNTPSSTDHHHSKEKDPHKKRLTKELSSNNILLEGFAKVSNFAKNARSNIFEEPAKKIDNTFRNLTQSLGSRKTSPQHSNNESLNSSLNSSTDYFTPFALSASGFIEDLSVNRKECNPLSANEWYSYFDEEGRISMSNQQILRKKIFYGGIHESIRSEVWPFLLDCYPFDSTHSAREAIKYERTREYLAIKKQWQSISPDQEKRFSKFRSRKHLIEKDVIRTDRLHPLFAGDDNPNLQTIQDILLTYSFFNFDIGYVQGMSDLLTVVFSVMQKEVDSFWCFVGLMDRLESNFHKDQNGMHSQLTTLSKLLKYMDPDLYSHFELIDSTNMYCFFQPILICFKREFVFEDVKSLWEILWSNYLTKSLPIFMCMAILLKDRSTIVEENLGLDQIIKFVHGKAGKMDLDEVLVFCESVVTYFVAKVSGGSTENVQYLDQTLRTLCESIYQY